jgi:hypothetical protein
LLVIAAVILLTLETIPGASWFLAATLVAGASFGFVPLVAAPLEKYFYSSVPQ